MLIIITSSALRSILWNHRLDVLSSDQTDTFRMKIHPRSVLEDTLYHLRHGLPLHKNLKMVFLGEPAVDVGGPLREFFHILVSSIAHNHLLFAGEEGNRVPTHNILELEKRSYFYVGEILAVSIVHGGPAPSFFTEAVADFLLYGIE